MHTRRSSIRLSCAHLLLALCITTSCAAQDASRFLRWSYEDGIHLVARHTPTMLLIGAGGAAVVVGGTEVDQDILDEVQSTWDGQEGYLKVVNEIGNPFILAAPVGLFGIGVGTGDTRLQDAAFTSFQSVIYAGGITRILKEFVGRSRPEAGQGPKEFDMFSGNTSMPSGHATIAFAVLTPWVYYYPHPATYGLLVLGAGTAVSRIALDRHWPTDVLAGGAIGFLMGRYLAKRHLSDTAGSAFSVTPLLSPNRIGLHVTATL